MSYDYYMNNKKIDIDVGLDISTSVIGICALEATSGNLIYLGYLKLSSYIDEYEKADKFENFWHENLMLNLNKKLLSDSPELGLHKFVNTNIAHVYIEEAAKKYASGISSANTLTTLNRFNGIISYKLYKLTGQKPIMINVKSARAKLGIKINYSDKTKNTKQKIFDIVKQLNPEYSWITHVAKSGKNKGKLIYDKVNEDMSDAWVICRGGQLLNL